MKIGITGAEGFLGWHVRAWLRTFRPEVEIRAVGRKAFSGRESLEAFCRGLDAIVHCAGQNRGEDTEVEATNVALAKALAAACQSACAPAIPRLVFANSTHIDRDSAYASGKRAAAGVLASVAGEGSQFTNAILPNLFGEFGRPYYNSAISTFCHQLTFGEKPEVHQDATLHLFHAQKAAALLARAALGEGGGGEVRPQGETTTVRAALDRLTQMHESYNTAGIVPDVSAPFDLELFNTLRSYRFPDRVQVPFRMHADVRGGLFETVKSAAGGQTFVSTTHPGITRGNHYHTGKFERFVVCSGEADISLRRLFSDQVVTFRVTGDAPCAIDMPTFCAHNITNAGTGPLITMFWANEIFDPEKPDTFSEQVTP
ncbi:MAG: SDR family oxidoreductase [Chthoniobacterales bacterium]|nr:SDR family oxidoreductase [Chthoniobacterales bacterium]